MLAPRVAGAGLAISIAIFGVVAGPGAAGQTPRPAIALVNPVDAGRPAVVSDKPTVNSASYTLQAWTARTTGEGHSVRFVFESETHTETRGAFTSGNGNWYELFTVPAEMPDGPYRLYARLFDGAGALLDEDAMNVTVTGAANGMAEPANALFMNAPVPAAYGFYRPPGLPLATKTTFYASEGTERVRAFYSTTPRGRDPLWKPCARPPVGTAAGNPYATARCALASGDSPTAVTLLAGLAIGPSGGGASDVEVVAGRAYRSRPSVVSVAAEKSHDSEAGTCYRLFLLVLDQRRASVWHAPVDLHAAGGAEMSFASIPEGRRVTAPALGDHRRAGRVADCEGRPDDSTQAAHRDGRPHAEVAGGTGPTGEAEVGLLASTEPTIVVSAWVDRDADDLLDGFEPDDVVLWRHDDTLSLSARPAELAGPGRVTLSGSLDGFGSYCNDWRRVHVESRGSTALPWTEEAVIETDTSGYFQTSVEVTASTYFRALSPYDGDACPDAESPVVHVRVAPT